MKKDRALEALAKVDAQTTIEEAEKPSCFANSHLEVNCNKILWSIPGCKYEYDCMIATNAKGVCDCNYKDSCFLERQSLRMEYPDEPCMHYSLFEERAKE
jgi:hypothetical protein